MMRSLTKTKVITLEDELYSCSADLVETCKGGAMERHNDVRHSIRLKQGPAFRISAEPVQVYVFIIYFYMVAFLFSLLASQFITLTSNPTHFFFLYRFINLHLEYVSISFQ